MQHYDHDVDGPIGAKEDQVGRHTPTEAVIKREQGETLLQRSIANIRKTDIEHQHMSNVSGGLRYEACSLVPHGDKGKRGPPEFNGYPRKTDHKGVQGSEGTPLEKREMVKILNINF